MLDMKHHDLLDKTKDRYFLTNHTFSIIGKINNLINKIFTCNLKNGFLSPFTDFLKKEKYCINIWKSGWSDCYVLCYNLFTRDRS